MLKLISISLENCIVLTEASSKGLTEVARIPFPKPPRSVVCENGLVISLVRLGVDCIVYAHEIVAGEVVVRWERLVSSDIRYSHIAVKGNVVYLGTFYKSNVPFDPLILIDFSEPDFKVKPIKDVKSAHLSNILRFRVCGSSLYVFENNYPMGVFEFDISKPNSPKFRLVRELHISNHLQFVKNFAVSEDRMAIISNYNDNLNLTNYLHVYGPKSFTIMSYFKELYKSEAKYIALRDEMGLLPESVELGAQYHFGYDLRRKIVKPISRFIQAFFSKNISKHGRFNVKTVSYLTDELVPLSVPLRIVDVMFNGDVLFFIANEKVGCLDFTKSKVPEVEFLQTKIESPIKLTHPKISGCIVVRSCTEYELLMMSKIKDDDLCAENQQKRKVQVRD